MNDKYQNAIDSILLVCLDPSKGLSDESLETARNQNENEGWFGMLSNM